MSEAILEKLLAEFNDGRTDLVFALVDSGVPATSRDLNGVSLMQTCAYFGDVSALRYLLTRGASLSSLGENLGLGAACFHGHWRLCKFLLEQGAAVNHAAEASGETALHAALCTNDRIRHDRVLEVLLAAGADPNFATTPGGETEGFMRDCRTKGETALHRAAAFGTVDTIQLLLRAGARADALDADGSSPLSWASWYLRPAVVLQQLCYGSYRVDPNRKSMQENLVGVPYPPR